MQNENIENELVHMSPSQSGFNSYSKYTIYNVKDSHLLGMHDFNEVLLEMASKRVAKRPNAVRGENDTRTSFGLRSGKVVSTGRQMRSKDV